MRRGSLEGFVSETAGEVTVVLGHLAPLVLLPFPLRFYLRVCFPQAGAATTPLGCGAKKEETGISPFLALLRGAWDEQVVPLSCAGRGEAVQSKSQTSLPPSN